MKKLRKFVENIKEKKISMASNTYFVIYGRYTANTFGFTAQNKKKDKKGQKRNKGPL